jgi:hypothetical protein
VARVIWRKETTVLKGKICHDLWLYSIWVQGCIPNGTLFSALLLNSPICKSLWIRASAKWLKCKWLEQVVHWIGYCLIYLTIWKMSTQLVKDMQIKKSQDSKWMDVKYITIWNNSGTRLTST